MPKTTVKFALIGCGRIGEKHAKLMQENGALVAVADIYSQKVEQFAKQFSGRFYTDYQEMLNANPEIDLVAICTPNGLHAQHSIDCLNAGHHVLCEKPMAIDTNDCEKMIAAAQKSKKQLFVVKQNRYNPPVSAVKQLLDENRLGKVYSFQLNCFWNRGASYYQNSWKGSKDLDGGTLFTQFSHFIDLLCWLFGPLKDAKATIKNLAHQGQIDFEDTGIATLNFNNGVFGGLNYTVNAFKKNMEGSLTIFGEKGTVKIGGQYLNELEYQLIDNYTIPDLPKGSQANNYGEYQGSMSNHHKVYENIIDVLQHNGTMTTTPQEGLETVRAIRMIYDNAKLIS